METGQQEHQSGNAVRSMYYDGTYVYSGGADGRLNVRRPDSLSIVATLKAGRSPVARRDELRTHYTFGSIATSSKYIFAGADDGAIHVWSKRGFSGLPNLSISTWDYVVEIAANEKLLCGVGFNGDIGVWDLESLQLLNGVSYKVGQDDSINSLLLSDSHLFVAKRVNGRPEVDLLSLDGFGKVKSLKPTKAWFRLKTPKAWVQKVCLTEKYFILTAGTYSESETVIFDRKSLRRLHRFSTPAGWESSGALVANDSVICTFQDKWDEKTKTREAYVLVRDADTFSEIGKLDSPSTDVETMVITDKYLVGGSVGSYLRWWDMHTLTMIGEIHFK